MTNEELNIWERSNGVVEVLTCKEFGAWLHRRDMNIKAQALESQQVWIPIEERLPNVGDRILVCYPGEFEPYRIDITIYGRHGFEISPCVEAWQPLPEPLDKSNI